MSEYKSGVMSTDNKRDQIWESLHDREYRKEFGSANINVGLAFQIHGLRQRQKLTREELAGLMGITEQGVQALEDPNYERYSLKILQKLAAVFDVALLVKFVPFSTLVDWEVNLTSDTIAPPSFEVE